MYKFSAILLLALMAPARAQLDTPSVPPEQDQRELYVRAAASRLVIIGRVTNSKGISERVRPEDLLDRLNKGTVQHGVLETIQIEEILCRQSDFESDISTPDIVEPLYIFIPFNETNLPDGEYREVLFPNRRYLLLLTDRESAALSAKFELDPNRIYYRGEEHLRGIIPLEPETESNKTQKPPDVVDEFRKLCAAMCPPKLEDKLALLQQLTDSADPVLRREAEKAEKAVRKQMQAAAEEQKQELHKEPK